MKGINYVLLFCTVVKIHSISDTTQIKQQNLKLGLYLKYCLPQSIAVLLFCLSLANTLSEDRQGR